MKISAVIKKVNIRLRSCFTSFPVIKYFCHAISKNNPKLNALNINNLSSTNATQLVIVAHPDDETIFFGAGLIQTKSFVLCLTNQNNPTRLADFKSVLNKANADFCILDYSDLNGSYINSWNFLYKSIFTDIEKAILAKPWDKIITHRPDGDYGHTHHKQVSKICTTVCKRNNLTNRLYYFNPTNSQNALPKEIWNKKLELLDIYKKHQPNAINYLLEKSKIEEITNYKVFKKNH